MFNAEPRMRTTAFSKFTRYAASGAIITLVLAALLPGFGQAASASVTTGIITSSGGPLNQIALNSNFNEQIVNSSVYNSGTFFPSSSLTGSSSSYIRLFNVGASTAATVPPATQTFGGDGTRENPFFLQNVATTTANPASIVTTQKITYVEGDNFYRTDVTLQNNSAAAQNLNFYRYADCYLAGSDSGVAAISAESTQCLKQSGGNVAISMIPITPGAKMLAGYYNAIGNRLRANTGFDNTCINLSGVDITATCGTFLQDNGFALSYEGLSLAASGGSVTLSYLTSYSSAPPLLSDLQVNSSTTAPAIMVPGQAFTFNMTVKNAGPSATTGTVARVPLPPQAQFVSASGPGFNAATGSWSVGSLAVNETATLTLNLVAGNLGSSTIGIDTASSANIDNSPCIAGSTANCGPQLPLAVAAIDLNSSHFTVDAGDKTANGTDPHTVSVNLKTSTGAAITGQATNLSAGTTPSTGVSFGAFSESLTTPGLYTANLLSTVAGIKTVTASVSIAGTPTSLSMLAAGAGGNDRASFIAGSPVIGPTLSLVTIDDANDRVANGDQFHSITVTLRDANANPISGAAAFLSSSSPAGVTVSPFTGMATPGVYTTIVRSTSAGSQPVTVSYAPSLIVGTVNANFASGDLDLQNPGTFLELTSTNPKIVGDPATVTMPNATQVHTVRARLLDQFNNPIVGQSVLFGLQSGLSVVGGGAASGVTNAQGYATLDVVSDTAGSYSITASHDGSTLVNGAPVTATFVPGPVSFGAGESEMTASTGNVESNDVQTHRVVVTARDQFGNPVSGANVAYTLPPGLNAAGPLTGTTGVDGEFAVLVRSLLAASFGVNATLNGTALAPATVTFTVGAPSAADSDWVITTASPQPAGASYSATVTVRDLGGDNPVPNIPVTFVTPQNVSIVEPAPYLTDPSGQVTVNFRSTVAGTYNVSAALGGNTIGIENAIVFTAATPDISSDSTFISRTSPTTSVIADGTSEHQVTATVVDQYGNPVANQPVLFNLPPSVDVAGGGSATVNTNPGGQAILNVVSTVADVYTPITATATGFGDITTDASGNDVSLTFIAGAPVLANSSLVVTPAGPLVVGTGPANTYTALITARDAFNNPVPRQQMILTSTPALRQSLPGGLTDINGQLSIDLTSTVVGSFTVETDIAINTTIQDFATPASVQYIAGPPDVSATGRSTLSSSNSEQIADGINPQTVTALLQDQYGNPIVGQDVTFDLPVPVTVVGGASTTVATDPSGLATINVVSTLAGTFNVTAGVGSALPGTPIQNGSPTTVIFGSGPVDPASSLLTVTAGLPSPLVVGTAAANTYDVDVLVEDAYDNPITGAPVNLKVVDGSGNPVQGQPVLSNSSPNTDPTGHARVTVTSTLAGIFRIVAKADGTEVASSPADVSWTYDAVSANNSVLNVSTGYREADGVQFHTATVTVKDQFGNIVPDPTNVVVTVAAPATGSGPLTTDSSGTASADITVLTAGTFAVSATIGGSPVYPGDVSVTFGTKPNPPVVNPTNGTVFSGTATPGNTITIVLPSGGQFTTVVNGDGTWSATPPPGIPFTNGERISVTQTNTEGISSSPLIVEIDLERPTPPRVNPSNGTTITGGPISPGSTITITDASGNPIPGSLVIDSNGAFTFTPDSPIPSGSMVTLVITDAAGNSSDPISFRIGLPSITLQSLSLNPGETQVAFGTGFQPGETVNAVLRSEPVNLGVQIADANGSVTFTFTIPASIEAGAHSVTLSGLQSGSVSAEFSVATRLAVTGSSDQLGATGWATAGLFVLGGALALAARRRRSA